MPTANDKRIAKNAIVLYIRMIVILAINLYISRLVLKNLGISDYGVYNVVGGVVSLFSAIGGALSGASSRFITFALGKNDENHLERVFSSSVTAQMIMASLAVILLETVGVWFLYTKMQIAPERVKTAFWCLQFSIFTCFVNFICIPYNALIIAHERMKAFAWISIVDCICKLIIVVVLGFVFVDRLFLYGLLLAILAVVIRFVYSFYCLRNFKESRFKLIWDKTILKEMFFFSLWNFIGYSAALFRDHGGNILLNLFFGPVVNAAKGIAVQVNSATNQFVSNFMAAVGPQITKNYACGNFAEMHKLSFGGAKISFFLFFFITLPILVNTKFIMQIWLHEVPDHTVWFVRLVLLCTLHDSFSVSLMTAQNATGNIRNYQLIVGCAIMMNLPLSYLCLKNGLPAESIFVISIIISILCFFLRLSFLKKSVYLDVKFFFKNVWIKSIIASLFALIPLIILCKDIESNWISFFESSFLCVIASGLSIYLIGCDRDERSLLKSIVKKMIKKIRGEVC